MFQFIYNRVIYAKKILVLIFKKRHIIPTHIHVKIQ